eukprot:2807091-Rhodomonas_salina.1
MGPVPWPASWVPPSPGSSMACLSTAHLVPQHRLSPSCTSSTTPPSRTAHPIPLPPLKSKKVLTWAAAGRFAPALGAGS